MHQLSIIIPTYNEGKFIAECLDSLLKQDYPQELIEILVVDGMSEDNTQDIVSNYCTVHPSVRLLLNKDKIVPHALNIGIKEAKNEVIFRIDAHCEYPANYISTLVRYLFELNADNVGAVINTLPAKNTIVCKAIAKAVCHPFGVGNSMFKIGAKSNIEVDTVPFGCFRKEIFSRIGLFDEELIRNQDDEFNGRIIKYGGKIFLIHDLIVNYYARDTISKMASMFYQYGLYKPLVNIKLGSAATWRQYIPFLFTSGLIIGAILSFLSDIFFIAYITVILIYTILSLYFSLVEAFRSKKAKLFFLLPFIFVIIHLSYGWGYLMGIFHFMILRKNKKEVTINR